MYITGTATLDGTHTHNHLVLAWWLYKSEHTLAGTHIVKNYRVMSRQLGL